MTALALALLLCADPDGGLATDAGEAPEAPEASNALPADSLCLPGDQRGLTGVPDEIPPVEALVPAPSEKPEEANEPPVEIHQAPPRLGPLNAGDLPVDHGSRKGKRVALTFDACSGKPPGALDQGVVGALEAAHAKATFFLGGVWATQDPARVERLKSNPSFELESHTYHHRHLPDLPEEQINGELARADDVLARLIGHRPRYVRAPYAECNPDVVHAARRLGLTVIGYDVASGDPDPSFSKDILVRWVLREVKSGSIVVFHANGRGWHTAEALPDIITGLRAKGFELVTVAELLGR